MLRVYLYDDLRVGWEDDWQIANRAKQRTKAQ